MAAAVETAMVDNGVLGITRHVQHLDARLPLRHFLRHHAARHTARQHHIGKQQIIVGAAVEQ